MRLTYSRAETVTWTAFPYGGRELMYEIIRNHSGWYNVVQLEWAQVAPRRSTETRTFLAEVSTLAEARKVAQHYYEAYEEDGKRA